MDWRYRFLAALFLAGICLSFPAPAHAQCADLRFNELDYDQNGTDTAEFVEIKGQPGTPLIGLDLHLINGLTAAIYRTEPLIGTLPTDGYLVVGSLNVAEVDIVLGACGTNLIHNGAPDAIGLWDRDSSMYCDFINYEGFVTGFEGWPDIGTDSAANCAAGASTSLARREASLPAGAWVAESCASPGAANQSPTALELTSLTGRIADHSLANGPMLTGLSGTVFAIAALAISRRVLLREISKAG